MKFLRGLGLALLVVTELMLASVGASFAQIPGQIGFIPSGAATLSATNSANSVSYPALPAQVAVITNYGTVAAHIKQGGTSVQATTSDIAIPPSGIFVFAIGQNTTLSAITDTGSTTLSIATGGGFPIVGSSGGFGGGGGGGVSSVALSLPGMNCTVSGSPVTTAGTLTCTGNNEPANAVWAGPTSGVPGATSFRSLVGADLPAPSAATLGGVESITQLAHNWVAYIDTLGVPHQSQPACSDLSNAGNGCSNTSQTANTFLAAPNGSSGAPVYRLIVGADLPAPSATTLGGIESITSASHQWVAYIDTAGVPHQSQPAFGDISGTLTPSSQLPSSGASAGSYTCTNETVTAQGIVTAASNGSCGGTPTFFVGAGAGAANAYTLASPTPSGFTLTNGYVVRMTIPAGDTNTAASTLNVNSTGATAIDTNASGGFAALVGGELQAGLVYDFTYNSTCTCFVVINTPLSAVVAGTSQTVTAPQWAAGTVFVVTTSAQTLTIPQAVTLPRNGGIFVLTIGQSVTITPNAGDAINGGSAGANATISSGLLAMVVSSASGTLDVAPTTGGGSGTITPAAQGTFAWYSASGTASTINGASITTNAFVKGNGTSGPASANCSDNATNIICTEGFNVTSVALTDASSIAVNAALSNTFTLTLTASGHTLANPTNALAGQWLTFIITGSGDTMSFGAGYTDAAGHAFSPTLNASGTTTIACGVVTTAPALTCYGPVNSAFAQPASVSPAAGPNSTSTTTMAGLSNGATVLTPKTSGNVSVTISGNIITSVTAAGDGIVFQISSLAGNGATNNGTLGGTACGDTETNELGTAVTTAADYILPFSISCNITGLTVGTAYSFDLQWKAIGATGFNMTKAKITASEIR